MGCGCGKNRTKPRVASQEAQNPRPASPAMTTLSFQYSGTSGLSVQGSISKRLYLFATPGAIVEVDARDAASLMRVPLLRRV